MHKPFHKTFSSAKRQNKKALYLLRYKAFQLVEVTGFEPATFWSRTKRATKLRYTSMTGANEGTRTPGLLITNQLLYQLSYIGMSARIIITNPCRFVQPFFKISQGFSLQWAGKHGILIWYADGV